VILVTLADNELMSVVSSSSLFGGVYFHGTAWLFWYGKGTGLGTKGCRGFCEAAPLVNIYHQRFGLRKTALICGLHAYMLLFSSLTADFQSTLIYHPL